MSEVKASFYKRGMPPHRTEIMTSVDSEVLFVPMLVLEAAAGGCRLTKYIVDAL